MTEPLETPEYLLSSIESKTLPKERWTHEAHLSVGLAVVYANPDLPAAVERLRTLISGYNESIGGQNTDTGGYHHTLTGFYVWAIDRFLSERGGRAPSRDLSMLAVELQQAPIAARDAPKRWYSSDILKSVVARRGLVAPDLVRVEGWPFRDEA
jgi:hypothetical protein